MNLHRNKFRHTWSADLPVAVMNADLCFFIVFVKIPAEYVLVAEEGPAHQKTYYMQLTLGEEVYHGSASSMKRAQHEVARMALERTSYRQPVASPPSRGATGKKTAVSVSVQQLLMAARNEATQMSSSPTSNADFEQQSSNGFVNFCIFNDRVLRRILYF